MHWSQNYSHKKVGFLKKKFFWTPCRYHLAFSEYFGWTVCYRLSHLVPLKIKMGCMTSYLLVAHWCQKRPFLGQKIQKKNLKSPAYDEIVTWKKKKKNFQYKYDYCAPYSWISSLKFKKREIVAQANAQGKKNCHALKPYNKVKYRKMG